MFRNVGSIDRFLRILLGAALVGAAWFGIVGGWGWLGLLPLLTGLVGFCPAYLPLGFSSCAATGRQGGKRKASP